MFGQTPFSSGLIKIYDAAYARNGWTEAMEACRRATSAEHTVFFSHAQGGDITFSCEGGSPGLARYGAVVQRYNEKFRATGATGYDDVGAAHMLGCPVGQAVVDTDIWSLDWLRQREEIRWVRERIGIFRRMYTNTSLDPLVHTGVHFWYHEDLAEIPADDIRTAADFAPHFARAFDLARWAGGLRRRYDAVLSVLDRIALGICLTDTAGRVVLANAQARALFTARDGIWQDRAGQLRTADPDRTARIAAAVAATSRTAVGEGQAEAVELTLPRRGASTPLLLIAAPLRDAEMELERGLSGCLLTIVDTEQTTRLRLDAFGLAYGLTPAERRAAGLLVSGLTSPQIAEEMGVATSTAETHVKAVFLKTGAKNRVSFVWRAMQFAPPIL